MMSKVVTNCAKIANLKKISLTIFSIIFLSLANKVSADGILVPPIGREVSQRAQKAIIFFRDNQETLIVSPSFQGNTAEFGWIIPTPGRPTVEKSSDRLFVALEEFIKPRYQPFPGFFDSLFGLGIKGIGFSDKAVEIVEQKRVDIYDITVVKANDFSALMDWFIANRFVIPDGLYGSLMDDYLDQGWYFTTVRIGNGSGALVENQLQEGHATPLRLTFTSDRLIYPLKLTSLGQTGLTKYSVSVNTFDASAPGMVRRPLPTAIPLPDFQTKPAGPIEVRLYLFTNYKTDLLGFDTVYAGWLNPDILKQLARFSQEDWLVGEGDQYLTILNRFMSLGEMTDDLYPQAAADNLPVGGGAGSLVNLNRVVLIGGLVVLIEGLALVSFFVVKKKKRV